MTRPELKSRIVKHLLGYLTVKSFIELDDKAADFYDAPGGRAEINAALDEVYAELKEKYSDKSKKQKLFGFFYNPCIHESAYGLISIHLTKEGAEKAMSEHKEKARLEFENGYKKHLTEEWTKDDSINESDKKTLIESIGEFDAHLDWMVDEIEILK